MKATIGDRRAVGALGLVVAGLALAALAHGVQKARLRAGPPPAIVALPSHPQPAVRALRNGERLDANSAQADELELLPGIGPRLAARIVDHRHRHGRFRSVDDLASVSGIGVRTIERLRPMLRIDDDHRSKKSTTPPVKAR